MSEIEKLRALLEKAFKRPWTYRDFAIDCPGDEHGDVCGDSHDIVEVEAPDAYPDGQCVAQIGFSVPGLEMREKLVEAVLAVTGAAIRGEVGASTADKLGAIYAAWRDLETHDAKGGAMKQRKRKHSLRLKRDHMVQALQNMLAKDLLSMARMQAIHMYEDVRPEIAHTWRGPYVVWLKLVGP